MSLLIAFALDVIFGDLPNRFHPVAWMGRGITWLRQRNPGGGPLVELVYGTAVALGGSALAAAVGRAVSLAVRRLPPPLSWVLEAALLKSCFSVRSLDRAAGAVQSALQGGDLDEARRLASWHLVSRETGSLSATQVAAAAIESVAENTSDSAVAPWFYYALGGLPLALAYRFINTADSLLGYHDPEREWLGKASARLDDLVNLLPSRLSALFLILAGALMGQEGRAAWAVVRRDARKTSSPNAGYPMSAMAGALGIELEKVGQYRLGAGGRRPAVSDISASRRLARQAELAALLLFSLLSALRTGCLPAGRRSVAWPAAQKDSPRRRKGRRVFALFAPSRFTKKDEMSVRKQMLIEPGKPGAAP